jgi:transcriptional regulator with XRE-family HTH domain
MRSDLSNEDRRFATRLAACRLAARLSRQKLADAATLSEATIKFIEKGRTKPGARTVHSLLQVPSLGLSLDDLPATQREEVKRLDALERDGAIDRIDGSGKTQRRATRNTQKDTDKNPEDKT